VSSAVLKSLNHLAELEKKLEDGAKSVPQKKEPIAQNYKQKEAAPEKNKGANKFPEKKPQTDTNPTHTEKKPTHVAPESEKKPQQVVTKNRTENTLATDNKKRVIFYWPYGGRVIHVAGTFSRWNQIDINKPILLAPGTYQYKFNVDGNWCHDVCKPGCDDNCGGTNNVITI